MKFRIATLLPRVLLAVASVFLAGQQAQEGIFLRAYVQPWVRLSPEVAELHFEPGELPCSERAVPLSVQWSGNKFSKQVQVMGWWEYQKALANKDNRGSVIEVEAKIGDSGWKAFPAPSERGVKSLLLTTLDISQESRNGAQSLQVSFRLCSADSSRAEAVRGVLHFLAIIR